MRLVLKQIEEKMRAYLTEDCFRFAGYALNLEQQYQILQEHLRLCNIGFGVPHDFEDLGEAIKKHWFQALESKGDELIAQGRESIEDLLREEFRAEPTEENMKVRITLPPKLYSLQDFPEQEESRVRIYGETSYNFQIATLSHYLHTGHFNGSDMEVRMQRNKLMELIREYLIHTDSQTVYDEESIAQLADNPIQFDLFRDFYQVPFPNPVHSRHTFIDLFAGIGGIRIPFDELGYECAFSSEWDAKACQTYFANFGVVPYGDIRRIPADFIPAHDVLLAGFPCQAFSIMGKMQDTK